MSQDQANLVCGFEKIKNERKKPVHELFQLNDVRMRKYLPLISPLNIHEIIIISSNETKSAATIKYDGLRMVLTWIVVLFLFLWLRSSCEPIKIQNEFVSPIQLELFFVMPIYFGCLSIVMTLYSSNSFSVSLQTLDFFKVSRIKRVDNACLCLCAIA